MHTKKNPRALALVFLFAASSLIAIGCSCDDDEFNGADACQKLVDAANGVLSSCGQPALLDTDVCSYSVGDCVGYLGCSPKVDVNACVTAIKGLDCTSVSSRSYASVTECAAVLDNIQTACSSSGSSDFD
ncbi:MAG TPA: hypothetical protein PK156_10765 [Polyangium sp.]|nr:hypothetical protein [Polyangium sp.]